MVNSWAYALQGLDCNSQMKTENCKISDAESPDKHPGISDSVERWRVFQRDAAVNSRSWMIVAGDLPVKVMEVLTG